MAHAIYTSFERLVDSNGVPLEDARVFVLTAGSSTLKTIYSDEALSVTTTNPIVLTSGGPHAITYVAAGTYKIQVETGGTSTLGSGTTVTAYSKDNIDTGVAVGSGALAVASGGTGATTAAGARTNLGAASSSEVADIAADVTALEDTLTGTDATQIATGTTGQRPVSPTDGQIRRNTTTAEFEGYALSGWENFKMSGDATSTANVTAETAEDTYIRPDRLKYSDRVAKAWARVTVSGGTPALTDGFNFSSSITDHGQGDFTLTYTNAMADSDYCIVATSISSGTNLFIRFTSINTTSARIKFETSGGAASDPDGFSLLVFGDFA